VLASCEITTDHTIFGDGRPAIAAQNDTNAVEVGVRFKPSQNGTVTGVRFYKGSANTGTHVGNLWSSSGTRLASATFTRETASGWQSVTFPTPVNVTAGTTYTASYHAPTGRYSATERFFNGGAFAEGPLTATGSVYRYGTSGHPTSTYGGNNYWVDVNFTTTTTVNPVPTTAGPTTTAKPTTTTAKPTTTTTKPTTTTTKPTTTTTTPPSTGGCALTAEAESCWAANTGVPGWTNAQIVAGQSPLQKVNGDVAITVDGTVYANKWVEGCIAVKASNVTIQNVLVRSDHPCYGGLRHGVGAVISTGDNGGGGIKNLRVIDTEIDGRGVRGDSMGIGQTEYTCIRCNIHGNAKGAKADQNVTVQDSYLHHLSFDGSTHTENFFYDGGAGNVVVKHNWMKANAQYSTAAVSFNNDWAGSNALVDSNYLEGNGGAGFTGGAMGKTPPNMHHIVVTNNKFSPNNSWGAAAAYGFDPNAPGNVWSNNTLTSTGALIPAPRPL
jgi:hypothetical protein